MGLKRSIDLSIRRWRDHKNMRRTLKSFSEWRQEIKLLPDPILNTRTLLIIRLDDIGDYILFRNSFAEYKSVARWRDYKITLLANDAWQSIYEKFDSPYADEVIWINKKDYLTLSQYRTAIWNQLRSLGFETVICPSRNRPLLLDDIAALATSAPNLIASKNTFKQEAYNIVSDKIYTSLYKDDKLCLEFIFNYEFARWTGNENRGGQILSLPRSVGSTIATGKIICFIGASARSKRWPPEKWVSLIKLFQQSGYEIIIAGGKQEIKAARIIASITGATSITGTTSLTETIQCISDCLAIVSGDTMAAHAAVALQKPIVIIANGVNAARFTMYKEAGIGKTVAVYPSAYLTFRTKNTIHPFEHYMAVSNDLKTIDPCDVRNSLIELIISN